MNCKDCANFKKVKKEKTIPQLKGDVPGILGAIIGVLGLVVLGCLVMEDEPLLLVISFCLVLTGVIGFWLAVKMDRIGEKLKELKV